MRSLRNDFRSIDPTTVRVVLLDGGEEPLANFGDKLSGRAARELEKMGVELRMRARVVGVDAMGVDVEPERQERISAHTVIWAAGVQASPLAKMLADETGAEVDGAAGSPSTGPRRSRSSRGVRRRATSPRSTVCRACVRSPFRAGSTPRTAYAGVSGAIHRSRFRYRDTGSAAAIGRLKAIVSVHGPHLGGFPGWVVWLFVHITFLNGFANRFATCGVGPGHDRSLPSRTRLQPSVTRVCDLLRD